MESEKTYKVMNTMQFRVIAEAGRKMDYNRTVPPEFDERLDMEGIHVITFSMLHEHIAGRKVKPHVRVIAMCKVRDEQEPVRVQIDMSTEHFDRLKEVKVTEEGVEVV